MVIVAMEKWFGDKLVSLSEERFSSVTQGDLFLAGGSAEGPPGFTGTPSSEPHPSPAIQFFFIPAGHMSENRTQVLDVQSCPRFPSDSESCDQGIWSYDCLRFRDPVPFFEDLFISMWLCWVFTAAHRLSLVAAVASPVAEHKL